jgi:hypothetical protein
MVFNWNIVDLTAAIISWNKKNILYKVFFIVPLNYLQFHHVRNPSDKDYSFHGFLSVQQHQVKYHREQNWDCDQILQILYHHAISF